MTEAEKYNRLIARYGNPMRNPKAFESEWMITWNVPLWIDTHIPALPNRMYINKDIVPELEKTFNDLIGVGVYKEIKTYDGLFNIRYIRGSKSKLSIHSWGLAIDLNAANNPLGKSKAECSAFGLTPFTTLFDEVWRDNGWTCGIDFRRGDGMHFEYTAHL